MEYYHEHLHSILNSNENINKRDTLEKQLTQTSALERHYGDIMESLERITKIAELNYKESVNSLRDTLEKQLLHLMPLLRGTNNHNEIIELEAKITKITRELKDNKDV